MVLEVDTKDASRMMEIYIPSTLARVKATRTHDEQSKDKGRSTPTEAQTANQD
jgi:hypothetical protein